MKLITGALTLGGLLLAFAASAQVVPPTSDTRPAATPTAAAPPVATATPSAAPQINSPTAKPGSKERDKAKDNLDRERERAARDEEKAQRRTNP
ncbi:hypothetical protein D3Y59_14765 [Hymenobacter oligotrophus]|uniref:Cell envelope biogenesis protein TolA n=1 Tax=Hymenobacter oligotrophus TaxID=2319843 RepID=A0A3B7R359_9BACT|nr:hypothetical protein [Hymenobacter oligotrophus]AYA38192.1 hypothetical protein D3Y59_14765 [Hymenobacter oligotrophus]